MTVEVCAATIDVDAFAHNLERVRALAAGAPVMAVVKANAYGHELSLLAPALQSVEALAVARVTEGQAARALYPGPVVVLEGVLTEQELALAAASELQLVVHDFGQVELLEHFGGEPFSVWLKLDSGMHRLGFGIEDFAAAHARLERCRAVRQPPRLMTHLACADERANPMTVSQLERFAVATARLPGDRSVANSAGILAWPASHDGWVRPGLMLYGVSPFAGQSAGELGLQPVMRLTTRLIARKRIARGETVGYGATWAAPADTWIGTAAIGYGDGYPWNMPSGTPVLVNGAPRALAGRVSMDMITIDLGESGAAEVGDEVELWGPGLAVEELASRCGRLSYELLCGVAQRVPRRALSS